MFSQDEIFALIVAVFLAFHLWSAFARQFSVRPFRCAFAVRTVLLSGLALAAIVLIYVLVEWSAHDVRSSTPYIFFYFVVGVAWLGLCRKFLDGLDLRARDDVLERGNPAAAWACGGALVGFMACFAGGNVGEGPGWWVVVYSAALATGAAGAAWIVLDMTTRLAESITIERDVAAGLRAAGFWIGAGLILGRAVAGNWVSTEATNRDFVATAWPVLILLAAALVIELMTRPGAILGRAPVALRGVIPGVAYAGAGIISLLHFGPP